MRTLLFAGLVTWVASPSGAQVPLTLDTSFRCTDLTWGATTEVLPIPDGTVWFTGDFSTDNQSPWWRWGRLLPNGRIDPAVPLGGVGGFITPTDDYIYVSGGFNGFRYFWNGINDNSYNVFNVNTPIPGIGSNSHGVIHLQPDGKMVEVGDYDIFQPWGVNAAGNYSILRVDTNAVLDSTFQFRKTNGVMLNLKELTDGRFLATGIFSTYEGEPVNRVIRLLPDYSLDTTFHSPVINGYPRCMIERPNGRVLLGGVMVLQNEADTMHLIRLMPDGTLDPTFSNHTSFQHFPVWGLGDFAFGVNDVEPMENGTMIVCGTFTHIDGQLRRAIALVDSAGNLLNTAFTGQGCGLAPQYNSPGMYSGLESITVAPDGSIYLCGEFVGFDDGTVSDSNQRKICRLHGLNVGVQARVQQNRELTVHPNPGSENITIEWNGHAPFITEVLDEKGQIILSAKSSSSRIHLVLSNVASGLYQVRGQDESGNRAVTNWIKQ